MHKTLQSASRTGAHIFECARHMHDVAQALFEPAHVDSLLNRRFPGPFHEPFWASLRNSKVAGTVQELEHHPHQLVSSPRLSPGSDVSRLGFGRVKSPEQDHDRTILGRRCEIPQL